MDSRELAALTTQLERQLTPLARRASKLYVGRTNYPERRLLQHLVKRGTDRMAVLHWAADWDVVARIETHLIEFAGKWEGKIKNASVDSTGRWSGAWNCVYLVWEDKASVSNGSKPFSSFRELDATTRICPGHHLAQEGPVLLRAATSPTNALQHLETLGWRLKTNRKKEQYWSRS